MPSTTRCYPSCGYVKLTNLTHSRAIAYRKFPCLQAGEYFING